MSEPSAGIDRRRQLPAQSHLLAQHAVCKVLSQALTLEEALPGLIREICVQLSWDIGFYWQLDKQRQCLVYRASWGPDALPETQAYREGSTQTTFAKGQGIPGIVWMTQQPSWRGNLWLDRDYVRLELAKRLGFREAVVVPVLHRGEVLGVLEFVSRHSSEPDQVLLSTLSTACFQVGQFQERLAAEARLRRSDQWRATMLRSIGDGVVATATDQSITFLNAAAEALLGVREKEALGRQVQEVTGLTIRSGRQTLAGSDGHMRVLEQSAADIIGDDGRNACGTIFVLREVTAQQWREDAARLLARVYGQLSAAGDGEAMRQRLCALLVPNMADAAFVFAQPRRDLAVQCDALSHRDASLQAQLRALAPKLCPLAPGPAGPAFVLQSGGPHLDAEAQQPPFFAGDADGGAAAQVNALLQVRSHLTVPLIDRNRPFGALCLIWSRSARAYQQRHLELAQELAQELSHALQHVYLFNEARQAVAMRDNFLSLASHELKTPLTPLKLQQQSLARQVGLLPQKVMHKVQVMGEQIARLEVLVNRLLDVSVAPQEASMALRWSKVDLCHVAAHLTASMADELQRRGIEVQLEAPRPIFGRWDAERVEQVMSNLLANAMKFGRGKPIAIRLTHVGAEAVVEVCDAGIGIDEADQQRIFERFERAVSARKFGGFGLGLYISKQIVEALGGRIWVHSRLGEGATFGFALKNAEDGATARV